MIRMLDTNTFILLLRGTALIAPRTAREKSVAASGKRIRERCRKEMDEGHPVGLSAISLSELEYGLHASGRFEEKQPVMQEVLLPFESYAYEPVDCVHHYGHIRYVLEKAGKTIGPLDMLIAAHALAMDATLITNNTREFRRVPGLRVEDWA